MEIVAVASCYGTLSSKLVNGPDVETLQARRSSTQLEKIDRARATITRGERSKKALEVYD